VLVEFTRDLVGVRSCGENDLFRKAMDTLARRIMTALTTAGARMVLNVKLLAESRR
jgi:hypothetical protein